FSCEPAVSRVTRVTSWWHHGRAFWAVRPIFRLPTFPCHQAVESIVSVLIPRRLLGNRDSFTVPGNRVPLVFPASSNHPGGSPAHRAMVSFRPRISGDLSAGRRLDGPLRVWLFLVGLLDARALRGAWRCGDAAPAIPQGVDSVVPPARTRRRYRLARAGHTIRDRPGKPVLSLLRVCARCVRIPLGSARDIRHVCGDRVSSLGGEFCGAPRPERLERPPPNTAPTAGTRCKLSPFRAETALHALRLSAGDGPPAWL